MHIRHRRTKNFVLIGAVIRLHACAERLYDFSTTDLKALTFLFLSFCKYWFVISEHRRGNPLPLRVLCWYRFHSRGRTANFNDGLVFPETEAKRKDKIFFYFSTNTLESFLAMIYKSSASTLRVRETVRTYECLCFLLQYLRQLQWLLPPVWYFIILTFYSVFIIGFEVCLDLFVPQHFGCRHAFEAAL